ncbi:MAG: antibiotic biosynthesis monooxygenase family protein [Planctomycetota bacterium]|jgi:heme-degrading monooxygenase HmoA
MQTIGLNYDVRPERRDDFLTYARNVLAAMDGFEGHDETRLYVDDADANSLMIYSRWASVDDFRTFMGSDGFKKAMGDTKDMLTKRPSHTVYQATSSM